MSAAFEQRRDPFLVSTAPDLIDLGVVHAFLSRDAYWSKDIPMDVVRRGIENCLAFGVYDTSRARAEAGSGAAPEQIGLARVITDPATPERILERVVPDIYRRG